VADVELISHLDADRCVVRVVGGEYHDRIVVVCRGGDPSTRNLSWFLEGTADCDPLFDANTPENVARTLLESLLSEDQLADWKRRRRFWVDTPRGSVELGELFNLRFRDQNGGRLVLCVVPEDELDLPDGDIWTTLLLTLRADPEHFFEVANWRKPHNERWLRGPVPLNAYLIRPRRARLPPSSYQASLF
jgi:hypothetical protein